MTDHMNLMICILVFGFISLIILIKFVLSRDEYNTRQRSILRKRRNREVFPESIIPKINPIIQTEETNIQYNDKEECIQPEEIV